MQQVNLYTQALKPKKVILSLAHMLALMAILTVTLGGITYVKSESAKAAQLLAEKKQLQVQQIEANVVQMRERVTRIIRDEQLVLANEKLKKKLQQREQLVELLGSSITAGNAGFSELMMALGRQNLDSMWLTRMYFGERGTRVGLEGIASKPDDVPEYLKKLRQEPAFLGRSFDLFKLEEEQGLMLFTLSSGELPVVGQRP